LANYKFLNKNTLVSKVTVR